MNHRICIPLAPASAQEFEDTRPALYYAADRWAHLPDGRRRDRRAANDAARPASLPVRAEPDGGRGARHDRPNRPERRAGWAPLGLLSVVAVATVALLGAATVALDADPAPARAGGHVASAAH
jgi:hypothetical protein